MRAATTLILMVALLSGCTARGRLAIAQSDRQETASAHAAAAGDGSIFVTSGCRGQSGLDLQDLWRKAPLAASWLGNTIPASSFVADDNVFVLDEPFFLVPNGDRSIPDVVLGRDIELIGPEGDRAFEFSDENGERIVVTIPNGAGDQIYHVVEGRIYHVARCH